MNGNERKVETNAAFARTGAIAALIATLGAGPAGFGDTAQSPLAIAYKGGATTLDPIARSENTSYAWQRHIFDTLTIQDRSGRAQPRIVTAWKISGQNRWRLSLHKGVKFQNGRTMTSADVAASIMDAATNPKSQVRNFVVNVSKAEPAGADAVEVTTSRPDPLLPLELTQIPVMPEQEVKRDGRAFFDQHPIGTGPYKFVGWLAQDNLVLESWDGYWDRKPAFRYVKLTSIPNDATRLAALVSGQVQVAEKVDPQDFDRVRRSGTTYLSTVGGERVIYLSLDDWRKTGSPGISGESKNPFIDPRVRRAVFQAVDVNALRQKIFAGEAIAATQFIAPAVESYDASKKRLPYDPAAAKKLLAEAGYPNGLTVRLDATNDRYLDDSLVAQALAGMLAQAGITVQVNAIPKAVFFPQMDKGEFSMFLAGWGTTDPVSAWNTLYHCRDQAQGYGTVNREHYCNPKADAMMARAASIFDPAFRARAERQAYELADGEDFAYLPLYWEEVIAGVNAHVGWQSRPDELILAWQMTRK